MQFSFGKESSVISFRGFFVKIHGFNKKHTSDRFVTCGAHNYKV
jgi:hypothetical protein